MSGETGGNSFGMMVGIAAVVVAVVLLLPPAGIGAWETAPAPSAVSTVGKSLPGTPLQHGHGGFAPQVVAGVSGWQVASTLVLMNNTLIPGNFPGPYGASNGMNPSGIAYDSAKGDMFVADLGSSTVSVISDITGSTVATINGIGTSPSQMAYDSGKGEIISASSNSLSVISDTTDAVTGTISLTSGGGAVAYDSGKGEIFASGSGSNNVSVINDTTDKVVATIPVGAGPAAMAYDSGRGEIFVANAKSNNVSVISDATNGVVANIPVWIKPDALAYDSVKGEVFVGNLGSGNLSIINDVLNIAAGSVSMGNISNPASPRGLAYDAAKGEILVANCYCNTGKGAMTIVSDSTNSAVANVSLGSGALPYGVVYDSVKGEAFETDFQTSTVRVVSDTTNAETAVIHLGTSPVDVAYDPGKGELYVPDIGSTNVSAISASTGRILSTIEVGTSPDATVYDSAKGEVFVANLYSNKVSVINDTTFRVVTNITVGTPTNSVNPDALAYDSGKGEVFVADTNGLVKVINDTTDTVVANISVGINPSGLAYDSGKGEILVADQGAWARPSNNVSVISDGSDSVIATLHLGSAPSGVAYDPAKGEIFVTNSASNNVSVVSDANNGLVATVNVGTAPYNVAFDGATGEAIVSNAGSGNVSILSAASNSVVETVYVGSLNSWPTGASVDSGNGRVYVANEKQGTISALANNGSTGPTLTSVSVSPTSAFVTVNGTTSMFTATTACSSTCPSSGINYSWTVTNASLGAINTPVASTTSFTAGAKAGTLDLFVNATLNGVTKQSPAIPIVITGKSAPSLSSVSISPASASLSAGAAASFSATLVCSGGACPAGAIYAWSMNHALGVLSSTSTPSVTFTAGQSAGRVSLFLNVTLGNVTKEGGPALIDIASPVSPLSVLIFFLTSSSGPAPLNISMVGNATGGAAPYLYTWSFGDGATASGWATSHTYTMASTPTVVLTVRDAVGHVANASRAVTVYGQANAGSLAARLAFQTAYAGVLPLTVTMAGSATGGLSPYGFSWAFGDGASGSGEEVTHTYDSLPSGCSGAECVYSVALTVHDSGGKTTTTSAQVIIEPAPSANVQVSMAVEPAAGPAPLHVAFKASVIGVSSPLSYFWEIGIDNPVEGQYVSGTYDSVGTYAVVLTAAYGNGELSQVTSTVTVYANASGAIPLYAEASPSSGPGPLTTYLQAGVFGQSVSSYSFSWDLGDGSYSVGSGFSHTFQSPGEYPVSVTATAKDGEETTLGTFVDVTGNGNHLAVVVSAIHMSGTSPLTVTFTPAVRGGTAPYVLVWNFGDGTPLYQEQANADHPWFDPVNHTYMKAGSYSPTLVVSDKDGKNVSWSAGNSGIDHPVTATGKGTASTASLVEWLLIAAVAAAVAAVGLTYMSGRKKRGSNTSPATPPGNVKDAVTAQPGPAKPGGPGDQDRPASPVPPGNDPFADNLSPAPW